MIRKYLTIILRAAFLVAFVIVWGWVEWKDAVAARETQEEVEIVGLAPASAQGNPMLLTADGETVEWQFFSWEEIASRCTSGFPFQLTARRYDGQLIMRPWGSPGLLVIIPLCLCLFALAYAALRKQSKFSPDRDTLRRLLWTQCVAIGLLWVGWIVLWGFEGALFLLFLPGGLLGLGAWLVSHAGRTWTELCVLGASVCFIYIAIAVLGEMFVDNLPPGETEAVQAKICYVKHTQAPRGRHPGKAECWQLLLVTPRRGGERYSYQEIWAARKVSKLEFYGWEDLIPQFREGALLDLRASTRDGSLYTEAGPDPWARWFSGVMSVLFLVSGVFGIGLVVSGKVRRMRTNPPVRGFSGPFRPF